MPPTKSPFVIFSLFLVLTEACPLPCSGRGSYPVPADTVFFTYVVPLCTGEVFQGVPIVRDTVLTVFRPGNTGTDTLLTWLVDASPLPMFTIGGDTLLCSGQTGMIAVIGSYAAYKWSTGAGSKSIDISTGGWYAATVTNSLGCQGVDSIFVKTIRLEPLTTLHDPSCHGLLDGSITVLSVGPQSPPPYAYQLNGSGIQASPVFDNLGAGPYHLKITDAAGCTDSLFFQLTEPAPFDIDIGPDRSLTTGDVAQLSASASAPVAQYQWHPTHVFDCDTCATPEVLQPATTAVTLLATDLNGCTASDTLQLFYEETIALYVPNAFSPNGDGQQDNLTISTGASIQQIDYFRVFDRWGSLVFERQALPGSPEMDLWDGSIAGKKPAPGVYIWAASVQLANRATAVRSGTITLIH